MESDQDWVPAPEKHPMDFQSPDAIPHGRGLGEQIRKFNEYNLLFSTDKSLYG